MSFQQNLHTVQSVLFLILLFHARLLRRKRERRHDISSSVKLKPQLIFINRLLIVLSVWICHILKAEFLWVTVIDIGCLSHSCVKVEDAMLKISVWNLTFSFHFQKWKENVKFYLNPQHIWSGSIFVHFVHALKSHLRDT